MPSFATIQAESDERSLVRKVQRIGIFVAKKTVELPTAITGPDSLPIDLKAAGWLPVGLVTPEGLTFSKEVEKDEVDAFGYASPVRSDVMRAPRTVAFTPLEKGRKHMQEITKGTDLSGTTQAVNGEIVIDEPDLPIDDEWRLLVIGDDGAATANWILGMGFGAVKLASTGEETWGREGAIQQALTFDVFTDEEVGVPVRHYIGGTGAKAAAAILGFTQAGA